MPWAISVSALMKCTRFFIGSLARKLASLFNQVQLGTDMSANNLDEVVVHHNYWRVPRVDSSVFSAFLEGRLTEEQRLQVIAEAEAARAVWKPNAEAMTLVECLEGFVGHKVRVQLWDASMWFHELEGPYPFYALCIGVEIRQEEEFPQAFLRLSEIVEIPNDIGYSPTPYFQGVEGCDHIYFSLSDLYAITKVEQLLGRSE